MTTPANADGTRQSRFDPLACVQNWENAPHLRTLRGLSSKAVAFPVVITTGNAPGLTASPLVRTDRLIERTESLLTKPFTALRVRQAIGASPLDTDAPVQRVLPWFRVAVTDASGPLTLARAGDLLRCLQRLPAALCAFAWASPSFVRNGLGRP